MQPRYNILLHIIIINSREKSLGSCYIFQEIVDYSPLLHNFGIESYIFNDFDDRHKFNIFYSGTHRKNGFRISISSKLIDPAVMLEFIELF